LQSTCAQLTHFDSHVPSAVWNSVLHAGTQAGSLCLHLFVQALRLLSAVVAHCVAALAQAIDTKHVALVVPEPLDVVLVSPPSA
jgi:hypothetical protein